MASTTAAVSSSVLCALDCTPVYAASSKAPTADIRCISAITAQTWCMDNPGHVFIGTTNGVMSYDVMTHVSSVALPMQNHSLLDTMIRCNAVYDKGDVCVVSVLGQCSDYINKRVAVVARGTKWQASNEHNVLSDALPCDCIDAVPVMVPFCFFFSGTGEDAALVSLVMCGPASRPKKTGLISAVVMVTADGVVIAPPPRLSVEPITSKPTMSVSTLKPQALSINPKTVYANCIGRATPGGSARALVLCYGCENAVYVSRSMSLFFGVAINEPPVMPVVELPLLTLDKHESVVDVMWHPCCFGDVPDPSHGVAPSQLVAIITDTRIVVVKLSRDTSPRGFAVNVLLQFYSESSIKRAWWLGPLLVFATDSKLMGLSLDGRSDTISTVRVVVVCFVMQDEIR